MCKMQCVDPSQRWYTDITYKSQNLIGRSVLDRKCWLYGYMARETHIAQVKQPRL